MAALNDGRSRRQAGNICTGCGKARVAFRSMSRYAIR